MTMQQCFHNTFWYHFSLLGTLMEVIPPQKKKIIYKFQLLSTTLAWWKTKESKSSQAGTRQWKRANRRSCITKILPNPHFKTATFHNLITSLKPTVQLCVISCMIFVWHMEEKLILHHLCIMFYCCHRNKYFIYLHLIRLQLHVPEKIRKSRSKHTRSIDSHFCHILHNS